MKTVVPEDISGKKGMIERTYFLRLSYARQINYKAMFWKMRDGDAQGIYEGRLQYVMKHFQNEANAPEVGVLLLCGLPDDIMVYRVQNGRFLGSGSIRDDKGQDAVYSVWTYYYNGKIVQIAFESNGGMWHQAGLSSIATAEMFKFMRWWSWKLAPNWNGWDLWREWLNR